MKADLGRAAALRRPRAIGAAFRSNASERSDATRRKAGAELRPGRVRRSAPSLPDRMGPGRRSLRAQFLSGKYLPFSVLILSVCLFQLACRKAQPDAVIVYCAQDQIFAEPILAEFTRQTGIRVKPVFDSEAVKTVGLANRLLAERAHPVCDVFWGNEELRTRQLAAEGVFEMTNGWAAFGQRRRQFVINTNRVSRPPPIGSKSPEAADSPLARQLRPAPSSLQELTNSRWRGQVSLAFPLFGTTATHFLALRQHWGSSNWIQWTRALAANQPFVEEGNSHVVKRVARGEASIGLTDSDDIIAGAREGLPVAALSLGPESLVIPNTVGLVAKPGADRAAARQLFEYLQSPPVQAHLIAAGALESPGGEAVGFRPNWAGLLRELDPALAELRTAFSP